MFCHLFYMKKACICTITTPKWEVGSCHAVCEQDKISPETTQRSQSWVRSYISAGSSRTQWLFFALTSPNYNGIYTPYTSLGHVATCMQYINSKSFSCMSKWRRRLLNYAGCVLLHIKQLRLGSGVWPNWVSNVSGSQHSWTVWIAPCACQTDCI